MQFIICRVLLDKQFKHGDGDFIYLGPRRRLFTTSAALQQLHAWLSLQPGEFDRGRTGCLSEKQKVRHSHLRNLYWRKPSRVIKTIINKVYMWRVQLFGDPVFPHKMWQQRNCNLLPAVHNAAPFICGCGALKSSSFPNRNMEIPSQCLQPMSHLQVKWGLGVPSSYLGSTY